jgi:ADP-ribosylation factor-like protein 2
MTKLIPFPRAPLGSLLPQVLELQQITKRVWRIMPCSALSGAGLFDSFDWMVKDISSRIYLFSQ